MPIEMNCSLSLAHLSYNSQQSIPLTIWTYLRIRTISQTLQILEIGDNIGQYEAEGHESEDEGDCEKQREKLLWDAAEPISTSHAHYIGKSDARGLCQYFVETETDIFKRCERETEVRCLDCEGMLRQSSLHLTHQQASA